MPAAQPTRPGAGVEPGLDTASTAYLAYTLLEWRALIAIAVRWQRLCPAAPCRVPRHSLSPNSVGQHACSNFNTAFEAAEAEPAVRHR